MEKIIIVFLFILPILCFDNEPETSIVFSSNIRNDNWTFTINMDSLAYDDFYHSIRKSLIEDNDIELLFIKEDHIQSIYFLRDIRYKIPNPIKENIDIIDLISLSIIIINLCCIYVIIFKIN